MLHNRAWFVDKIKQLAFLHEMIVVVHHDHAIRLVDKTGVNRDMILSSLAETLAYLRSVK